MQRLHLMQSRSRTRIFAGITWGRGLQPAPAMKRIILFLLAGVVAVACSKKVTASQDFKAAMAEFKPAMTAFTTEFPKHELALQKLRHSDPGAAAKKIEADIVPLIDKVATIMAKAHEAGTRYVDAASDEDPAVISQVRANVVAIGKQKEGFTRVRDLYAQQAKKLAKGKLTEADQTEFAEGIQAAMTIVATAGG